MTCPDCHGYPVIKPDPLGRHHRDPDWDGQVCPLCNGQGTLDEEWFLQCLSDGNIPEDMKMTAYQVIDNLLDIIRNLTSTQTK